MKKSTLTGKFYAWFFPAKALEQEIRYELYSFIEYSRKAKIVSFEYHDCCSFILTIRYQESYHVCAVDRGEIHFDEKFICPYTYLEKGNVDTFATVNKVKEILDEILFSR
jgi:hypothetical protein